MEEGENAIASPLYKQDPEHSEFNNIRATFREAVEKGKTSSELWKPLKIQFNKPSEGLPGVWQYGTIEVKTFYYRSET